MRLQVIYTESEGVEPPWLLRPSVFKTAPIGLSGNFPMKNIPMYGIEPYLLACRASVLAGIRHG